MQLLSQLRSGLLSLGSSVFLDPYPSSARPRGNERSCREVDAILSGPVARMQEFEEAEVLGPICAGVARKILEESEGGEPDYLQLFDDVAENVVAKMGDESVRKKARGKIVTAATR